MIADVVVILIVLGFCIMGYRRGFVRTVSRLVCLAVALIGSKFLYPYISSFVGNSFIGDAIYNRISENSARILGDTPPSFIQKAGDYTASGLFDISVDAVSAVALIIIIFLLARIAAASLNLFAKLPVISFFNRLTGLAAGLLLGIAAAYLVVTVAVVTGLGGADFMNNSAIAAAMYNKNYILDIIF